MVVEFVRTGAGASRAANNARCIRRLTARAIWRCHVAHLPRTFAGDANDGASRIHAMSDQALQAELQRLQCLQALGITVYHPRYRLSGAKPSEHGIWPDGAAASQITASGAEATAARADAIAPRARTPVSPEVPVTPRAPASRPSLVPEDTTSTRSPTARPAAPTPKEATVAVENFQLLFLQVDDELALINQIPALARPQLQGKQLALLTNLLRWLGKSMPVQEPRMFRWPLPGLEQMAASMSAETSVLHFLEQARRERAFRFLLQLGPRAVTPPSSEWQTFATHSLDEMLALPSLKREVWETLLPLHALLHARA